MSVPAFLFDECINQNLLSFLTRFEPGLDFLYVGGPNAPPKRTPDPVVLAFAESQRRAIVTNDVNTMPIHASDHIENGRRTWGIFYCRKGVSVPTLGEAIVLIWAASDAEEWLDQSKFIPWDSHA